jgi:hypothetical protein
MSVTRALALFAFALVCAFASPASAVAQQRDRIAPPGNSAIDEYLETVPGADGNRPVERGRRGNGLSRSARRRLEALGPDGRLAAEVLGASIASDPGARRAARSPQTSGGPDGADGASASAAPASAALAKAGPGSSGLAAVLDGVLTAGTSDGGPGMGALLPLLLIGAAVAFAAGRALRGLRRRG